MSSKYGDLFDDVENTAAERKEIVIPRNDEDYKMGKPRDSEEVPVTEKPASPSPPAEAPSSSTDNSSASRSESSSPPTPGAKTLISLLEEGCRKLYNTSPEYKTIEIEDPSGDPLKKRFQIQCYIHGAAGRLGTAISQKVKLGKHMAAGMVLRQIVADDMHKSFNIPGKTKPEAIEYINSLMPELNVVIPEASPVTVNYIGKLNEICQKNKLSTPHYTDEVAEPGNYRIQCQIGRRKTSAEARTKKQAKNQAAMDMLTAVEHLIVNANMDEVQGILLGTYDHEAPIDEPETQASSPSPTIEISYGDDLVDGEKTALFKRKIQEWVDRNVRKGSEEFLLQLVDGTVQFMKEFFANLTYDFTTYAVPDVNGCLQGFIQFSDFKGCPARTFFGSGKTEQECRDAAAFNVLRFVETGVSDEPEVEDAPANAAAKGISEL